MLSKQTKQEMLQDGLSEKRRKALSKFSDDHVRMTLDEYLDFLAQAQRAFGPFPISQEKTITKYNKL